MSHIAPYPIHGGEKIRAAGLIRLLSHLGPVEAIVSHQSLPFLPSPEALPQVQFHPFNFHKHMKPVLRYYWQNRALKKHIQSIIKNTPIDLAFIDYQFYGKYIDMFHQAGIPVIYGTHNSEAQLTWQEIQRYSGKAKLKQWVLYHLQVWHERLYFPHADGFIVVSPKDAAYYERWMPVRKILQIPNFIYPELYETSPLSLPYQPRKLVMTGNFTVFQNQDGVEWFLQQVWYPQRLYEDFDLWLVGHGSEEMLEGIPDATLKQNVKATGTVESISAAIQDAAAAIVPLRYGSGTRLKILEAMWHRVPLVSTSLGAEGIDGESGTHFLLADDPASFGTYLHRLQNPNLRQDLIDHAWDLLHRKYTLAANQGRLEEFMEREVLSDCL